MWKKQEQELQKQLVEVMVKRGTAAQEGDLSENADYKMFTEQQEMISVRLAQMQKMIRELEKDI